MKKYITCSFHKQLRGNVLEKGTRRLIKPFYACVDIIRTNHFSTNIIRQRQPRYIPIENIFERNLKLLKSLY